MQYESAYEKFAVTGPDGKSRSAEFVRAGFLTRGDRPELYFFRVGDEEVVVGISGDALKHFEHGRRCLSREEKIDIAGSLLQQQIEAGKTLDSENLFVRDAELARIASQLNIP